MAQHQRNEDVVRNHDGERDALDDDHRGRGRQSANEGSQRQRIRSSGERQSQHEHVWIDAAARESEQAADRDRHHEQIDHDQIERKQPSGAADLRLALVLDDGDVELPRQKHDRGQ